MASLSFANPVDKSIRPGEKTSLPAVDMTPWRYAKIAGVLVSAATICTYAILAQ
jgi:uncharacterized sodium:solute symporter family permease YidK